MELVLEAGGTHSQIRHGMWETAMTHRLRGRAGFTLLETLVVVMVGSIVIGAASPAVGRMLAQVRIERAATIVAADMRAAATIAATQRRPVRIEVDAAAREYQVRDHLNGTVFVHRAFAGPAADLVLSSLVSSAQQVVVFPNGLSSGALTFTLRIGGEQREIVRSRAGQVRITS
jgi:prepilin-type N-terminal cleavage/methylation domain-containing protein